LAEPTGIKIVRIHNARAGATDENDEWILINNDGDQPWNLSGWMITDQTATQQLVHIYRFPEKTVSGGWSLDPGERRPMRPGECRGSPRSGEPFFCGSAPAVVKPSGRIQRDRPGCGPGRL
jgi:hypothetical protein